MLNKHEREQLDKVEKLVQGIYAKVNPFPRHAVHCRGVTGDPFDLVLARLETITKDLESPHVILTFPHDRDEPPRGMQG